MSLPIGGKLRGVYAQPDITKPGNAKNQETFSRHTSVNTHISRFAPFLLSLPRPSDRCWSSEYLVARPAALTLQTLAQQLVSGLLSQPWPENTSACQDQFIVPSHTCILGPVPISERLTTLAATLPAPPFNMQPQPRFCGVTCSGF